MATAIRDIWQRWQKSRTQRIYIIPTRYGYGYAGLLLLMLLGAINYDNSLGHLLCFLLASLGHVTMHHSHRNLRDIDVSVTAMEPVFCLQSARFQLNLNNRDNHDSFHISIAHRHARQLPRWQFIKAFEPLHTIEHISADNNHNCSIAIPTQQRGWQPINTVRLASNYPLGIFFSWTLYPQTANVLVYPQAKGGMPLPTQQGMGKKPQHKPHTGNEEFAGLRNYREGEPLHRVAWKAMARDDIMRSKQFSSPEGDELWLHWADVSDIDDVERKLSQLCQWLLDAETAGALYGLDIPGTMIQPNSGEAHQHQCLKALALYHD